MDSREPPLERPVEEKIFWARDALNRWEYALLGDQKLTERISMLKQAIHQSRQAMAEAGVAGLCRACEVQEGGSCCGAGIEKHFSSTLILVNMLLNAPIPRKRHDPLSCFFLSEMGCRLLARHVICVNFLCDKITSCVSPEKIAALREREGIELDLLFLLQERIRGKITSLCHDS